MLNFYKITGLTVLWLAIFAAFVFLILPKLSGCNGYDPFSDRKPPVIIHDTLTVERYQSALASGTKIKFIEKPFYIKSEPIIEYRQKIDSVFFEKIKFYDFILGLEKTPNKLRVYAVNLSDSLLKEKYFDNVGNDFSVFSDDHNIFVKSKRFYWEGVQLNANYIFKQAGFKSGSYTLGARTGLNYMDRFGAELGTEFNLNNNEFATRLSIKTKLF